MLASRLDPPERWPQGPRPRTERWAAHGRRRPRGAAPEGPSVPTRGPRGPVRWWRRAAPRGDDGLWRAVRRLQARRLQLGVSVSELARRTEAGPRTLRRETISRVLNGTQATSWATVEVLAELLDVDIDDLRDAG